uniref:Uncharacterized protein n=1 Tax=Loxodonta africana TaxID=9785 RepID=G3UKW5_LOXAF
EKTFIHLFGIALGQACIIVLSGAIQQILDEAERFLHDALCVVAQTVKDSRTIYGRSCSEMWMAHAVTQLANRSVAMKSYSKALRMLPTIIADNAGYNSAALVAQLRAAHSEGNITARLDMKEGTTEDMTIQGLLSVAEAAKVILCVDVIKTASTKSLPDHHPC